MNINIITLGCSKNNVDSEVLASQFRQKGHTVFHNSVQENGIDWVVINTCSFIQDAKTQAIDEILLQLERKKQGFIKKVYVIGCLAQRYEDDLRESLPEIDGIFPFLQLNKLLDEPQFDLLHQTDRILSTPKHYAYLKISEGCDRQCAYCAIPLIRGKQVSKPIDMLVKETESLASQGVKEIMLIAQDLTAYGIDISQHRDLEKLLRKLAQVQGIEWIRMHYAYPINFPYEILDVMNEYSNICRYIDIPLQHISETVLKSMNRGGTPQQMYNLIERIRNKVPGIAIRSTLISGYPTETREHHKELLQFVKDIEFDRLGFFSYSQEEGTPAFPLGDPIKEREKNRRLEELIATQEEISLKLNKQKVNSVMKVIVDDANRDYYIARSEFDSPDVDQNVLIRKKGLQGKLQTGEFYNVNIEKADMFDLYAKKI
ncbi:MAG: 30S ribosomal protein S12 methylthiotransferase RimO [Bacteroidales bacterium]|nr:30S ribosomal protein S12 methylthiotransferase RimO [Bacteroidales bacterium]